MTFAQSQWLYALWALPALALLFYFGARRRRLELAAFTGRKLGESLAPGGSWRKNLLKASLKVVGVALVILALARPQFGSQLVKVEREGIDLVVALDVSLSMLAEDMKPNRLDRAKQEIVDLIRGLRGDRVGIVAFAGDAFVLCPLTVDYDAALMFTQTADVDIVSKPGSALDEAIETCIELFQENSKNDRVVILVTDGENHRGDPVGVAKKAGDAGIRIYTIGIGNPAGELIPLRGTDGSVSGYKKDKAGETVLTRLDEHTLRQVAQASEGKYLPATREGLELKVLYKEIEGLEKSTIEGEFVERKQDRFQWFLAVAFVLLGVELLVSRRGMLGRGRERVLHTGVAAAAVVTLCVAAMLLTPRDAAAARTIDRGKVKSGNQYYDAAEYEKALALYREALRDSVALPKMAEGVLYNEANVLHRLQRYEDALNRYNMSIGEDSLATGRALYNRGNTLMALAKPQEAVESYVQSLQYMPDDEDARHNLEMALRALQEQQQQQNQDQQQNQNEGEQQNQDQQQNQGEDGDQQQDQDGEQQQKDNQQDEQDQNNQQQSDSTQTNPEMSDSLRQSQVPQSIKLTREDALRILKLLEEQEKELQKEKRKAAFQRVPKSGKDW